MKVCSVGQALMQVIDTPENCFGFWVGLGVDMHSRFASRFLNDLFNAHCFRCSYMEVLNYQQSSAVKFDNILVFLILGCDTTSRLYDIGNKILLGKN